MTTQDKTLPHPDEPGQTHYDGCWQERGHHNCAVAEVWELLGRVDKLKDAFHEQRVERDKLWDVAAARMAELEQQVRDMDVISRQIGIRNTARIADLERDVAAHEAGREYDAATMREYEARIAHLEGVIRNAYHASNCRGTRMSCRNERTGRWTYPYEHECDCFKSEALPNDG